MLANMPATTTGIGNINPLPSLEQGQCIQYNFLKRKLNVEDTQQQQQEQINNSNGAYQGSNNMDGNAWKKRHTEQLATLATTTTTKAPTCFDANSLDEQFISNNAHKNLIINNNNNNNMLSNNINNNVTIPNNNNNNDLQFSLSSSSFINDLFSYDNNLIVPVSISAAIDTNATIAAATITASSAGGNIAPNYVTNDDANWQATDLLELDHRYNSTLQAVENAAAEQQSPATTATGGTTATSTALTLPTIHQLNPTIPPQQHQQQAQQHFLIPQKQIARSQHMLTKYRQHYQQQHSQQQQQHQHTQEQHTHQQQPQQQQQQQHPAQQQDQLYSNSQLQQQQSSDSESDFEDKNLSWLLNFKFDELPHLSPDIGNAASRQNSLIASESVVPTSQHRVLKGNANNSSASSSSQNSSTSTERSRSKSPKTSSKASKKFEELVMEVTAECDGNDMIVGENVVVEDYSPKAQKKPPFTYTELIEYALEDKGELTVSGIYQWISDRFPFYKSNDDRWKNSVRHNLSINPHFRKGVKAPQGAGHLWTISSGDSAENVLAWEHKKQRLDLFFKMESMNRERIQEHQQKIQKQQHQQQQQQQQQQLQQHQLISHHPHQEQQQCSTFSPLHQQCQPGQCLYDEAAAAAAAITQEMLQQSSTSSNSPNTSLSLTSSVDSNVRELRHGFHELHGFNDLMTDEELRKTAGQILNGIHRDVEVQSVNSIISTYHDVLLDTDYLNPIHKDVAVNESGLRNTCHNHATSQYYITEIDPIELGIQMSHQVEEEVLFSDEFNLNYFGYNAGNDIVA